MGLACLTCGNSGFTNAFVQCVGCLDFVVHRYCLDVIPKTIDEYVHWLCDTCDLKVQHKRHKINFKALENGKGLNVDSAELSNKLSFLENEKENTKDNQSKHPNVDEKQNSNEKKRSMVEPNMEEEQNSKKIRKECTNRDSMTLAKLGNDSVLPKEKEEKKRDEKISSEQPCKSNAKTGSGNYIKEDGVTASSGFDNQGYEMNSEARIFTVTNSQNIFAEDPSIPPYLDPEAPNEPIIRPIWSMSSSSNPSEGRCYADDAVASPPASPPSSSSEDEVPLLIRRVRRLSLKDITASTSTPAPTTANIEPIQLDSSPEVPATKLPRGEDPSTAATSRGKEIIDTTMRSSEEEAESEDVTVWFSVDDAPETNSDNKLSDFASVVRFEDIPDYRASFAIPENIEILIPGPEDRIWNPPHGCLAMYIDSFYGFRVPIPEYVERILCTLRMCPAQFTPFGLGTLIAWCIIMRRDGRPVSPGNFARFFSISESPGKEISHYLTPRSRLHFIGPMGTSLGPSKVWKSKYIFLRYAADPLLPELRFNLPRKWRRGSVRVEHLRPNFEPEWVKEYENRAVADRIIPTALIVEPILRLAGISSRDPEGGFRGCRDLDWWIMFSLAILKEKQAKLDAEAKSSKSTSAVARHEINAEKGEKHVPNP